MFQDAGLTDLSGPPSSATREYTVQFNESDLHFATRLMEEEGWFYFFQHAAGAHTLVIANANTAFQAISGATLYLLGGGDDTYQLLDFNQAAITVRGKMTFSDYDPENPDTQLDSEQPTVLATGGGPARDHFRWPALSFDQRHHHQPHEVGNGSGRGRGVTVRRGQPFRRHGGRRKVHHHQQARQPVRRHLCVARRDAPGLGRYLAEPGAARPRIRTGSWPSPRRPPGASRWSRRGRAWTASTPRWSWGRRAVRRPTIKSQSGEEIYTDDLARVKVRFYWDHRGESTGDASIWARVIQPWAGKGWGAQFIPRVGTEVAVAFVDGDPDRPIVIGGLYNGRDTPIYAKTEATKSGIRTRSSLSGSTSQFNEFTFDDKAGSELIFMHAEKDLFTEIENNQTLTVDNSRMVHGEKGRDGQHPEQPDHHGDAGPVAHGQQGQQHLRRRHRQPHRHDRLRGTKASRSARATAPSRSAPATTRKRSTRATTRST